MNCCLSWNSEIHGSSFLCQLVFLWIEEIGICPVASSLRTKVDISLESRVRSAKTYRMWTYCRKIDRKCKSTLQSTSTVKLESDKNKIRQPQCEPVWCLFKMYMNSYFLERKEKKLLFISELYVKNSESLVYVVCAGRPNFNTSCEPLRRVKCQFWPRAFGSGLSMANSLSPTKRININEFDATRNT